MIIFQTQKTYIRSHMKMADLINENYSILLLLEHLEIDFVVGNITVAQLCQDYQKVSSSPHPWRGAPATIPMNQPQVVTPGSLFTLTFTPTPEIA